MPLLEIKKSAENENKILVGLSCSSCISGAVVFTIDINNKSMDEIDDICDCGRNNFLPPNLRDKIHYHVDSGGEI